METPEQFDLFEPEERVKENNLENPEEEEMGDQKETHEDEADKAMREKIQETEATTIKGLQKELYGWKPVGAQKEIGPGRKKALAMLEKLKKMKEDGK